MGIDWAPDLVNNTVDRDDSLKLQNSLRAEWKRLTGCDDQVSVVKSVEEAIDRFRREKVDRKVLVCGSLHLLGGVLTILGADVV
jgi:folylpolyglutamate synthase